MSKLTGKTTVRELKWLCSGNTEEEIWGRFSRGCTSTLHLTPAVVHDYSGYGGARRLTAASCFSGLLFLASSHKPWESRESSWGEEQSFYFESPVVEDHLCSDRLLLHFRRVSHVI